MRIDVLFDTSCPWCFIGKKQLDLVLDRHPSAQFKIYWHAFLINPDIPSEGVNYMEHLQKKFGRKLNPEHALETITRSAKTVNIQFDFTRINRIPNTIDSHRMVRFAARQNRGSEMLEAIYQNYFLIGSDIGDRSVLVDIGAKIGLNSEEIKNYLFSNKDILDIQKQNKRAQRLDINGIPAFIFNQNFSISGAHEPNILNKMIDIARENSIDDIE